MTDLKIVTPAEVEQHQQQVAEQRRRATVVEAVQRVNAALLAGQDQPVMTFWRHGEGADEVEEMLQRAGWVTVTDEYGSRVTLTVLGPEGD